MFATIQTFQYGNKLYYNHISEHEQGVLNVPSTIVSIQQGKELTIICLHCNNGSLQVISVYLFLIQAMYV